MLEILQKRNKKGLIHIIKWSPNQHPNYKKNFEMKPKEKYKVSVVIFDVMLGVWNSSQVVLKFFSQEEDMSLSMFITIAKANLV